MWPQKTFSLAFFTLLAIIICCQSIHSSLVQCTNLCVRTRNPSKQLPLGGDEGRGLKWHSSARSKARAEFVVSIRLRRRYVAIVRREHNNIISNWQITSRSRLSIPQHLWPWSRSLVPTIPSRTHSYDSIIM